MLFSRHVVFGLSNATPSNQPVNAFETATLAASAQPQAMLTEGQKKLSASDFAKAPIEDGFDHMKHHHHNEKPPINKATINKEGDSFVMLSSPTLPQMDSGAALHQSSSPGHGPE